MKNFKYLLIALSFYFFSCDVLDQESISDITQNNAFVDESDAQSAIIGAYDQLQAMMGNAPGGVAHFVAWGDARGDTMTNRELSQGIQDISDNMLNSTSPYVDWSIIYGLINITNTILVEVPQIEGISESMRDQIVGEALFLRGLSYFYLVRLWGDVPLVLTPYTSSNDEFKVSQVSKNLVFTQIIEDLIRAESFVPSSYSNNSQTRGRATLGAVNALQAHVYLWKARVEGGGDSDLNLALDAANKVLNNGNYIPWTDYNAVFENENTAESIFEVQYDLTLFDANSLSFSFLKEPYNTQLRAATQFDPLFLDFISTRPEDNRISTILQEAGPADLINDPFIVKYKGKGQTAEGFSSSDDNIPIFRITGIQLLKAEILALLGDFDGSMALVNNVRNRAGLADLALSSQTEILEAVLAERNIELFAEGHRWFDLIRNGKAVELSDIVNENHLLWPISLEELTQNPNLVQNTFY